MPPHQPVPMMPTPIVLIALSSPGDDYSTLARAGTNTVLLC